MRKKKKRRLVKSTKMCVYIHNVHTTEAQLVFTMEGEEGGREEGGGEGGVHSSPWYSLYS